MAGGTSHKKYLAQLALSAILMAVLVIYVHPRELLHQFTTVHMASLMIAAALLIPSLGIRAWRWHYLMGRAGYHIAMMRSWALLFVGTALNLILPAGAGDVAKSYVGYRWSGLKEPMLAVSLSDKIIALGSVGLMALPFAILRGQIAYALAGAAMAFCAGLFVLAGAPMARRGRVAAMLDKLSTLLRHKIDLRRTAQTCHVTGSTLTVAVIVSIIGWLISYGVMACCFTAAGASIPPSHVFGVAALLTLIRLFPLTLNGIGSDEAALLFFFGAYGSGEVLLAGALLYRLLTLVLPGIIGWIVLMTVKGTQTA